MPKKQKEDSWWPTPLQHIANMDFLDNDMVTVAEISEGAKQESTRDFYMALVKPEIADRLLKSKRLSFSYLGFGGLQLSEKQQYLEPLVVRWEGAANVTVQLPTERFLQEFSLTPRLVDSIVYWDDLTRPLRNIIIHNTTSTYAYPKPSLARVQIRRDYLLKYANAKNRSIIVLWYEWNDAPNQDEHGMSYSADDFGTFQLPGRDVQFMQAPEDPDRIIAEFWGIRLFYTPNSVAIMTDDTPPLYWPGINEQVTRATRWLPPGLQVVYVKDSVLDIYENRPDVYCVHPDTGGVSYINQWSVSYCRRIGRDLISVEIRKLYEGCYSDVIQHWHKHTTSPQTGLNPKEPNVATRSKRIIDGMLALGGALSRLYKESMSEYRLAKDIVGLDAETIQSTWWYDHNDIRPITRRIPLDMGRSAFLDRCELLAKLVIEHINEKHLRSLLIQWGVGPDEIKKIRTLKLLDLILQFVSIADDTGLHIVRDFLSIRERYGEKLAELEPGEHLSSPIAFLFILNDIRNIAAHHKKEEESKLPKKLGITSAHVADGWGRQLDLVYDHVGEALEAAVQTLIPVA